MTSTLGLVVVAAERPDDRLVAGLKAGDEKAFTVLYRRHTPRLFRSLARLLGGNAADAEDAVQETWIRAVRGAGQLRSDASFEAWLIGIGAHVAIDMIRRVNREIILEYDIDQLPVEPAVGNDVDLEAAIAALPAAHRTVLLLHDIEGFDHAEIASQLGVAVGTSRSLLHRARARLRIALVHSSEKT